MLKMLGEVAELRRTVDAQRDEIARLKNGPRRPNIKPSGMEKATEPKAPPKAGDEPRKSKTSKLTIHEERTVKLRAPPQGSRFKGYTSYVVQDLMITPHVVKFRCERWQTANGETTTAPLPAGISGQRRCSGRVGGIERRSFHRQGWCAVGRLANMRGLFEAMRDLDQSPLAPRTAQDVHPDRYTERRGRGWL